MKTWLITGCSTGLGRSLAKAVLDAGFNAVVTARDARSLDDLVAPYPDTVMAVSLDVTDRAQVDAAVASTEKRFGAIDVLVNNAGYGYRAAVEEGEEQAVATLFDTNLFGPVSMIKAALPTMRARRSGTIVNVSSIAARRAMPGSGYYAATKFALEGMSDALRRELAPLGIRVMVVEPGPFRTDFAGRSLTQSATVIDDYAQTAGLRRKENDRSDGTQKGDPRRAAETLIQLLAGPDLPFRLLLGSEAVSMVRQEISGQLDEIDAWKDVSLGTDFPDGE
jgi:NAD(P)-dependent dehydrogenase (short-subunit alcohol dehydrogenase family)